jgi:hypothetical protein
MRVRAAAGSDERTARKVVISVLRDGLPTFLANWRSSDGLLRAPRHEPATNLGHPGAPIEFGIAVEIPSKPVSRVARISHLFFVSFVCFVDILVDNFTLIPGQSL